MSDISQHTLTRRGFVATGAASVGASLLPSTARAQAAKFRRHDISDPALPANVVSSYKKAVTAMLQLPATDPRNWYRNAFTHVFDCPHGNWWFLTWHRAYIGWFERKCRELSGDDQFALPYWDWTKTPRVPAPMFEDVLDPHNPLFVASFATFKQTFDSAVSTLYGSFTQGQKDVLAHRGLSGTGDFWTAAQGMFFDQPGSRGLTAANPNLDAATKRTVAIATIRSAIRATTFTGFSSGKTANHSAEGTKGVLESQPHDNVHGAMGGQSGSAFMVSFLSPVDPIFFIHHANLDRLWDVWTRRQKAKGRPTLPQGADLTTWSNEQFLFYVDEQGQPVTKTKPSDYESMSVFDYDYAPGSGEDQVPVAVALAPEPPVAVQTFAASITAPSLQANATASATASVPATALQPASPEGPPAVAEISINLTSADEGRRFRVFISPEGGGAPIEAGAITVFGHHAAHEGPTTFTVPLPEDLSQSIAPALAPGGNVPLNISVVPLEQPGRLQRGAAANQGLAAPQASHGTGPAVTAVQIRTQ